MIPRENAERWWKVVQKHAKTLNWDAVIEMALALDLQVTVSVKDKK